MIKRNWLFLSFIVALGILIVYRSYAIPITHDESGTWFYSRHLNLWKCFFDVSCWNSANIHWLNSLLLQLCAGIGGDSPWVIRLPNALSGIAYLVAASLLVNRYLKNYWARLFGFLLLCLQIYLLDFFSLARGYGMMTCGVLWGLYSLLRYSEKYELRWFVASIISLSFALLANFTSVIPFVGLMGAWVLLVVGKKQYKLLWQHGYVLAIATVVLSTFLFVPLRTLSKNGEFEWGADNIMKMGNDLLTNLMAGETYLHWFSPVHILYLLVILLFFSLVFLLLRKQSSYRTQTIITYVCLANVLLVIVLLTFLTGAKTPIGRKSVFLVPLLFTPLILSLNQITRKSIADGVCVFGSVLILLHFFTHIGRGMKSCREWYYDAYYPELFAEIVPAGSSSDSISLGATWIFIPAMMFYQKTLSLPISGLKYEKQIVIDTSMQYYYLDPSDFPAMDSMPYIKEKFIGSFCLFKRVHEH
jgi:hypothetical protein